MKWILNRDKFINEAKLRDALSAPQKRRLVEVWGEKYLDYEEVKPTDRIHQGKWKLTEEDKDIVINRFFKTNYSWVREKLASLPDNFAKVLSQSLVISNDDNRLDGNEMRRIKIGFSGEFNIKKLKISQISCLNYAIFRSLNAGETKSDSIVVKGEDGKPLRDENNNIIKKSKEKGEPSFSNNIVNLNTFLIGYNNAYPDHRVDATIFLDSNIQNITNMIEDNNDIIDFDLFGEHEMFLIIEHNATNIMNMSVSKFYKSCQEMYFGGGHGTQYMRGLLMNVFDPNTIPAFLSFNTPYYNISKDGGEKEKLSDVLPLCRLLVRSIEPFNEESETKLYFDKTYPDRMEDILVDMIQKYSDNEQSSDYIRNYPLAPDIKPEDLKDTFSDSWPYMDKLDVKKGKRIGINTKKLALTSDIDWREIVIDKNIRLEELIIETPEIPKNLLDIKLNPKWIKFKYLTINNLSVFKNIITDSIAFYQCKLNDKFLDELYEMSPNLKRLSLGNVDVNGFGTLSKFLNLEELELIFTIPSKDNLETILSNLKLKKLTISTDLLKDPKNKQYITQLKKTGVKISLKGLDI